MKSNDSGSASRSNSLRSTVDELDVLRAPWPTPPRARRGWPPSRGPFPRSGSSGTARPAGSGCDRCRIRHRATAGRARVARPDLGRAEGCGIASDERTDWPLSSAITAWNRGNCSYGTPPPFLKHSTMSSSTLPRSGDILREHGQVVGPGRPRQVRGVLRRQLVADALRIDADDARGDHRAEPFAHIALVEAGA